MALRQSFWNCSSPPFLTCLDFTNFSTKSNFFPCFTAVKLRSTCIFVMIFWMSSWIEIRSWCVTAPSVERKQNMHVKSKYLQWKMIHLLKFNYVFPFKIKTHIFITYMAKFMAKFIYENIVYTYIRTFAKLIILLLNQNGLRVRK